jgi:PAS domain S-box-containing protein
VVGQKLSIAEHKMWVRVAAVTLLIGFAAWANAAAVNAPDYIVPIWAPNALVLALLLLRRGAGCAEIVFAALIGLFLGGLAYGDPPGHSLGLAACNAGEVALVCLLLRLAGGAAPYDITHSLGLARFGVVAGLIAPAVVAVPAVTLFAPAGAAPSWQSWATWTLTDGLGNLVVAPIPVLLADALSRRAMATRRTAIDWATIMAGGTAATIGIFIQSSYPFLFFAGPFVLAAAFRLGVLGGSIATLIVTVIASVGTTLGHGPIQLVVGGPQAQVLVLQVFLLATFVSALPVAVALRELGEVRRRLADREGLQRAVLDNLRDVIFRVDAAGCWSFLNPAWSTQSGVSVDAALGTQARDWIAPESRAAFDQVADELAGGADRRFAELSFQTIEGGRWTAEARIDRLIDEGGQFAGLIGNLRDVTLQRADQRALMEGQQRLRMIAELSPAGIVRTDARGDMTYASPSWLRLTGLRLEDVLGTGWAAKMYPEAPEAALDTWRALIAEQAPFQREFRFTNEAGQRMWVVGYGQPELGPDGEVTGFIVLVLDITDRMLAERKLAERERDLSAFASNVSDAVFRLDLDGRCLYVTPSVQQVLGYVADELIGEKVLARLHPDDQATIEDIFAAMASGQQERAMLSYRARNAGGDRWLWLEANSRVVRDANGAPREVVASVRDVTERKQMEEALDRERLRAESATQAKSRFLASMSHEIRTPMNGVLGFADLLLAANLPAAQHEQVRMIAESGRMMMQILNEILDHSKIEAGQMAITSERVDLVHAIRRSVRLFESAARQKGIGLVLELDPELPRWIASDGLRLRQIVTNLVGNAVKFTRSGDVRVVARMIEPAGTKRLRVEVTDTGPGIPPDRFEAIFGEFVQVESGPLRAQGGTGLGLSISRSLARLMGGTILIESEFGVGSRFSLDLPLVEDPTADAVSDAPVPAGAAEPATGALPARVLVAEDNEINQRLICTVLAQLDIQCDVAPDGRAAIAAALQAEARGQGYDLVLMDLQMPEVDGFEAVRGIRAAGLGPAELPVVALTANAYQEDIRAALAAGMQDHLAKPVDLTALTAVLRRWARVPAEAPVPTLDPALDELRPQFRRRLRAARVAMADWPSKADDPAARAALRGLCHQIAGNAALFGYPALGDVARLIDRSIADADAEAAAGLPVDPAPDAAFVAALALLERRAREAAASERTRGAGDVKGRAVEA